MLDPDQVKALRKTPGFAYHPLLSVGLYIPPPSRGVNMSGMTLSDSSTLSESLFDDDNGLAGLGAAPLKNYNPRTIITPDAPTSLHQPPLPPMTANLVL